MKSIDVCMTPELMHLYDVKNRVVVVVDVLRATSCMVSALANGVKSIIPVSKLEECEALRKKGCVGAAERDGKMAEGFDLGNSPFAYMDGAYAGKIIAMTTTNGTQAISRSKEAAEVVIGAFLNKTVLLNYLCNQPNDVLVLCAGWKGKVNLEDTLFAGALVEGLKDSFYIENDSALAAQTLYNVAKKNMMKFLGISSHAKRLRNLHIEDDIKFCLTSDVYSLIPVLKNNELVVMEGNFVKV